MTCKINADTTNGLKLESDTSGAIDFQSNGVNKMSIDSSGNLLCGSDGGGDIGSNTKRFKDLYLSGGVYVGGTGSANLLDDYEEGTYTPVLSFGGGTTGITYSSQVGIYTKVGRKVTVTIQIQLTSKGTSTGNAGISMPFTSASIGYEQGHHQPYLPGITVDGRATHYAGNNTTNSQLVDQSDAGGAAFINNTNFVNTSIIRSTITYFTS